MKSLIDLLKTGAQSAHIERTQHPRGLLTIAISPSKTQRVMEITALFASAAVLATTQFPVWAVALGWLALAVYAASRTRAAKNSYVEMQILSDDRIELRREGALESTAARVAGQIFVSPAVVAFCVEGDRSGAIVLTADQIPAAQFRSLRVRLKHLREPS
jgi:hypothetical protein